MTSRIIVNNIEADFGINTVSFNDQIRVGSATTIHSTGIDLGSGNITSHNINSTGIITATSFSGDGSALTGIAVDTTKIETGNTKVETIDTGSDGHIKLTTEGTERLRVLSGGKVAIGDVTANSQLDVHGGDGISITSSGDSFLQSRTTGTTGTNYLEFKDSGGGSGAISYHHNGDSMRFKTGGSERLRIFSDGSVRIGDSSISVAAVGSGPTLGICGSAPEITLKDSASGNPYAVMRTNDYGSLYLEADQGNDASSSAIHLRVDGNETAKFTGSDVTFKAPDGGFRYYFAEMDNGDSAELSLYNYSDAQKVRIAANNATFFTGGQLLVGKTSSTNDNIEGIGYPNLVQIEGAAQGAGLQVKNATNTARINLIWKEAEGSLSTGDKLGAISFGAGDSTSVERARIEGNAEFTHANGRGGQLKFYTCPNSDHVPAERFLIASNGDVTVKNGDLILGTAGKGISFINAADTSIGEVVGSSVLDDYEEGTWSPTIGGNASYDIQWGYYVRVGRLVQLWGGLRPSSMGTGNARMIYNLPYQCINSPTTTYSGGGSIVWCDNSATSFTNTPSIMVDPNTYTARIGLKNSASTILQDSHNFWQNNHRANFHIVYYAKT